MQSYVEGLFWVLRYYHSGCGSWTWYYPYLYAPLASDLVNLSDLNISFDQGRPFTPLLQLLSVLPPQSAKFLPPPYTTAMTSPKSSLYQFYPLDFEVDANGKKNAWECVVQIPFIEEDNLVEEISGIDHLEELTLTERERNILGSIHRFLPPNIASPTSGADQSSGDDSRAASLGGKWGNALEEFGAVTRRPPQEYQPSRGQGGSRGGDPRRSGGRSR